ncbi:MAG TPA: hypothetical protein V6C81_10040 [Planktothrix sp.]|jgi:hypothetical protein
MANPALESITTPPIEQASIASQQLLADVQRSGASTKVSQNGYDSVNVDRQPTDDGALTRYPNGVKIETGVGVEGMTAPPGGKIEGDGKGGNIIYDSHHKVVANIDADRTAHIHTKNGEYTETSDGKVSFTPSGATSDLRTLHKPGHIPHSKLEDYGVSTDGKQTRFPNGVEYDPKTGNTTIPSEYPNFHEDKETDLKGSVTRRGTDGHGKTLYVVDSTGIHVPTSDGTLSENGSGSVSFKPNETQSTKHLPKIEIDEKCMAPGADPLCGLDLGKF